MTGAHGQSRHGSGSRRRRSRRRRSRPLAAVGAVWLALLLVVGPGTAVAQESHDVDVQDDEFVPRQVVAAVGDTVVWTQSGAQPHSVTADDGSFDSHQNCSFATPALCMQMGDTYERTFTEPGEVAYYCKIHGGPGGAGMAGTVVVQEEAQPEAVVRLSGTTRFDTAIASSRDAFADGEAGAVVLARSHDFADALAGTPLAVARDAPILLTLTERLLDEVATELRRVLPSGRTVYLLGGTAALSERVEQGVRDLGYEIRRLFGPTRIETAIEVAGELGDPDQLLITTGFAFPDALAAGAAAAQVQGAVLLTTSDRPHPAVDRYLDEHEDATVYAVGGPAVRAYPDARPVSGTGREETAVEVARTFFAGPAVVGVARRDGFADALTGGAHIGRRGGPMLLTPTGFVHPAPEAYLCGASATLATAYVYGGTTAVDDDTAATIGERIRGVGCG